MCTVTVQYGRKNLVNLLHKMTSGGVIPSNDTFEIGAGVVFYFDENVGNPRKGSNSNPSY